MELYHQYLMQRHYTPEYLAHAKGVIERASKFVYDALLADGVIRWCEPICMFLSRILEKEGVWNCAIKGSLAIRFARPTSHGRRLFHHCTDPRKKQGAGHVWLIAPPFKIVDVERARTELLLRQEAALGAETNVRLAQRQLERIMQRPDLPVEFSGEILPATPPQPLGLKLDRPGLAEAGLRYRMELFQNEL